MSSGLSSIRHKITSNPARVRSLYLSHDVFNERSGTVIACALTSQEPRAGFPLTLELTGANLPKRSWVKISEIRTLSVKGLGKKLGRISVEELDQVVEGTERDHRLIANERGF